MTTLLPDPHDYAKLSQHFIRQAEEELQKGDHLQAAEKGWGAVAHAVKAIAEQRGWNHGSHPLLRDVYWQIITEFGRTDLALLFDGAEKLHQNFYENHLDRDEVEHRVNTSKSLLEELAVFKASPPRPFVPRGPAQQRRWNRLTR